MSSLEEEATLPRGMESAPKPANKRRLVLARGGSLTRFSGLGGAHDALLNHHRQGRFEHLELLDVLEYPEQISAFSKVRYRWSKHPKRVRAYCQQRLGPNDILHITDQEQAHLAPPRSPNRPNVVITVHDLFHLFPFEQRVSLNDGEKSMGEDVVKVGEHRPGRVRRRDLVNLKQGLSRADLLVCDSAFTRDVCQREFPNIATVIVPLGLNSKAYAPSNELDKNETFTMLFVGSSDPRKRLPFIVKLLGTCEKELLGRSTLHVVGDQRQTAEALAKSIGMNVVVHPRLEDQQLMQLRQQADVLLFPSAAEGYGYPPIESMASGCAVLCSDLPAHNELMPMGTCLPAGDIGAWRLALAGHFQTWNTSTAKIPDRHLIDHARQFSSEVFVQNMTAAYDTLQ
tara:strand:+ start:2217 stop:3413 length:1197 start_codon:yes stop_codon:yes gene_type:complete